MSDTLGQLLRQAREARGETLDEVERATRIRTRQLSALEADNFAALPSPAQARGFIKNYAQYLGLDLQDVLERYEESQKKRRPGKPGRPAVNRTATAPAQGRQPAALKPQSDLAAPAAMTGTTRTSPVRPRPRRLLSADVLVATVVTLALLGLMAWGGSRLASSLAAAAVTPTASRAAGLTPTGPTLTQTTVVEATATLDLPSPAASYNGVNVTVRAELRTWVSVKVDGTEKFASLMPPGEARQFVGQGVVEVVTGNGKGTRIVYNGVDQGVMGDLGMVVDRLWTLQGMVIPSPTITPTPSVTPTPSKTPAK